MRRAARPVAVLVAFVLLPACSLLFHGSDLGELPPPETPAADAEAPDGSESDAPPVPDASEPAVDAAPAPCDPVVTDGLLGYWPLDDGAGTVARDCSGAGRDGALLGVDGATWIAGARGGGVHVSATAGCIDLGARPELVLTGGFTAMAWVRVAEYPVGTTHDIFGKTSDIDTAGWRVHTAEGNAVGSALATPGQPALSVRHDPVPANAWHHVTMLFEPSVRLELFVDGGRVGSGAAPPAVVDDPTANARIGCRGDNTLHLRGDVDEVRLYARPLTDTEIAILAAR